jgi:hypothetical protein
MSSIWTSIVDVEVPVPLGSSAGEGSVADMKACTGSHLEGRVSAALSGLEAPPTGISRVGTDRPMLDAGPPSTGGRMEHAATSVPVGVQRGAEGRVATSSWLAVEKGLVVNAQDLARRIGWFTGVMLHTLCVEDDRRCMFAAATSTCGVRFSMVALVSSLDCMRTSPSSPNSACEAGTGLGVWA